MSYFENKIEDNILSNISYENSNIILDNPVLYIFLGFEDEFKDIKEKYSKFYKNKLDVNSSVEYMCINYHDFDENLFIKSLEKISNNFLNRVYSKATIRRIYLIVNCNKKILIDLKTLLQEINSFFYLVKNSVLIDIFSIIDDFEKDLKFVDYNLKIIDEIANLKLSNMSYILTTLNNNIIKCNINEIFDSIPYCSFLKDCTFEYKNKNYYFNEHSFIENATEKNSKAKHFSFGMKNIEKPKEIIKAIILNELLDKKNSYSDNFNYDELSNLIEDLTSSIKFLFESFNNSLHLTLNSLALNNNDLNQIFIDNESAINKIFGNYNNQPIVDAYYEINFENFLKDLILNLEKKVLENFDITINNYFENINIGFYTGKEILVLFLEKIVLNSLAFYIKKENENKNILLNFKKQTFVFKSSNKFIFSSKTSAYFDIAFEYISLINQCRKSHEIVKIFEKVKFKINNYIENINKIAQKINDEKKYLNFYVDKKILKNSLMFKENFILYYKNKTDEFINNNYNRYFDDFYKFFYKDGIISEEKIFEKCNQFSNLILTSNYFIENTYSEIYYQILSKNMNYNEEEVKEFLLKEVIDKKIYYSNLISQNLYEKTCVITGDKNFILNFFTQNSGVELFFDKRAEDLNIIYFNGPFSLSSLYYHDKYLEQKGD